MGAASYRILCIPFISSTSHMEISRNFRRRALRARPTAACAHEPLRRLHPSPLHREQETIPPNPNPPPKSFFNTCARSIIKVVVCPSPPAYRPPHLSISRDLPREPRDLRPFGMWGERALAAHPSLRSTIQTLFPLGLCITVYDPVTEKSSRFDPVTAV